MATTKRRESEMAFTPTSGIPPFWGWTAFTPALPEFYWNVYSAEERIKKICLELHKLCEYSNMLGENINIDHGLITELQEAFEQFMASGFDDYYKVQVHDWIQQNFQMIMDGLLGHMLFFGLTESGYFTAYVPEKWAFVLDTVLDYQDEDYGCLTITY